MTTPDQAAREAGRLWAILLKEFKAWEADERDGSVEVLDALSKYMTVTRRQPVQPPSGDREARAEALYNAMKEEGSPMGGFTRWATWAEVKNNASGERYYRGVDALAAAPKAPEAEGES